MSETIARFMGTNEEDDEEVIEVDIKGEDEDDDEENHIASSFMVNMDGRITTGFNSNPHQHCLHSPEQPSSRLGGGRRSRPLEEKERTKLRERHRRAITAKILAGLRRHGNYNLRVRADINDVIAALAREAGWVVLPDGTTFPAQSQGAKPSTGVSSSAAASSSDIIPQQTPSGSLQVFSSSYQSIEDQNSWDLKSVLMHTSAVCDLSSASRSLASAIMGDEGRKNESYPLICGSNDAVDNKQVLHQPPKLQERDFSGTPYIPVYVMLPFGVINMNCELTDPDGLLKQLRYLKSINVDGIMVNCWWGVVEAHSPQEYKWVGYKKLFQIVRELKLKLQVVMSFHVCGGNFGDDLFIHLPHWVTEIGRTNPDIYFTDKDGRRNHECLSWGIDKERILRGRTAVEVYYDFMRSFRSEFDEFFEDGIISMIEVGLGPCGELRYPSYPVKHGWRYPGIGEFQCYDQFLLKSLRMAAEARGHSFWARGPENAGSYNSQPNETGFFCEVGDYDGYYGRFFLKWYTEVLLDHADRVLSVAKLAFEGTCIVAKLPRIHWWYKTSSHAAELTAGFYNPSNRDGYATVMAMLKKHGIALSFSCSDVVNLDNRDGIPNANADPVALSWQVLNAAWDASLPVFGENSLPCHSRDGYNRILDNAKPFNDPDGRHLLSFAYHRLSPLLMERRNFTEFERFVKRMHGEVVLDLPA